ncbi:hypothetical protein ACHAPV_009467 [Trichoderma viride]
MSSNEAGIDEAEEDGRDEDELEDNTVKLDTSAKASSGRWVTSAGALERSAQRASESKTDMTYKAATTRDSLRWRRAIGAG